MIKLFTLTIEGKPIPQERPYVARFGTFDRSKSAARKKEIKLCALVEKQKQKWIISAKEINFNALFVGAHGGADLDNLTKIVWDAFTGIIWVDDKQVISSKVLKRKCRIGEQPHTVIILWEQNGDKYGK